MLPPKRIIRTVLAGEISLDEGVYILAYMKKIIYIGKAVCVKDRIRQHVQNALDEELGTWMIRCDDWANIRLDILIPPDDCHSEIWLKNAESACIHKFNPLLNMNITPGSKP